MKCKKCGLKCGDHAYCERCDIERRIKGLEHRVDYYLLVVIKYLFSQFKENHDLEETTN